MLTSDKPLMYRTVLHEGYILCTSHFHHSFSFGWLFIGDNESFEKQPRLIHSVSPIDSRMKNKSPPLEWHEKFIFTYFDPIICWRHHFFFNYDKYFGLILAKSEDNRAYTEVVLIKMRVISKNSNNKWKSLEVRRRFRIKDVRWWVRVEEKRKSTTKSILF